MDLTPRPNRQLYLDVLRRMTPEQRLLKAFELTELTRELLRAGLRRRYPLATADELHHLYLERLARCQSRAC